MLRPVWRCEQRLKRRKAGQRDVDRHNRFRVEFFCGQTVSSVTESAIVENVQVVRKTPPVSRTLRLLSGSWLLFEVAVNIHRPGWKTALIVSCTFVAIFVYYALLHRLVGQRLFKWAMLVKAITILPVAVVFFAVPVTAIQLGIFAFFGVSLVVQALRGDRGCEVMTLPTLAFRRQAHCPCLLFSPLDRFEESIYRALRRH